MQWVERERCVASDSWSVVCSQCMVRSVESTKTLQGYRQDQPGRPSHNQLPVTARSLG